MDRSLDPPSPPPPGRAQRLVARSGFVVYEGGRSLFDEPVLVFISRPAARWPDFDIFDHLDRPLGSTGKLRQPNLLTVTGPSAVYDTNGSTVLSVKPQTKLFRAVYNVSGVAAGSFDAPMIMSNELTIGANNEAFGYIKGPGLRGLGGKHLTILDANRDAVGQIRTFREHHGLFRQITSHVLSLDPQLRGELRRLIIAAPLVLEGIKRSKESSS